MVLGREFGNGCLWSSLKVPFCGSDHLTYHVSTIFRVCGIWGLAVWALSIEGLSLKGLEILCRAEYGQRLKRIAPAAGQAHARGRRRLAEMHSRKPCPRVPSTN